MKKVVLVLAGVFALGIAGCGPTGLGSGNSDMCLIECSNRFLKANNKCALANPDDHNSQLECMMIAKKETDQCNGRCYGNL